MFKVSANCLSVADRQQRWEILSLISFPLIGSFVYNQGYKIPLLLCPLKYLTGIPCPFCGLTRSFLAVAKGNLSQGFDYHLFGPFLFAAFLIILIHITIELVIKRKIWAFYLKIMATTKRKQLILLALINYYIIRIIFLANSGELYDNFTQSPLGKMIL